MNLKNSLETSVWLNERDDSLQYANTSKESSPRNIHEVTDELFSEFGTTIYSRYLILFNNQTIAEESTTYTLIKNSLAIAKNNNLANAENSIIESIYHFSLTILERAKKDNNIPLFSKPVNSHHDTSELEAKILSLSVKVLKDRLNTIPQGDKVMLIMKYLDGWSISQIAKMFSLEIAEVEIRLKNAQINMLRLV